MQLQVQNMTRTFGKVHAVENVSFALKPGRVYAFVGPNGAGKTTTMRAIATLDEPTSGDVLLDGVSIVDYPEVARAAVGFMPDTLPMHSDITVREYVDFFARAHGLRRSKLKSAVERVEEFTGLGPLRDKTLKSLSKGMRQRVSLARALVHDPQVLVLDEPAAGLDPRARVELRELVRALGDAGKTLLVSSHILTELSEICTDVIIIEKGRILRCSALRGNGRAPEEGDASGEAADAAEPAVRSVALRALGSPEALQRILLELPYVRQVRPVANELVVDCACNDRELADLLRLLVQRDIPLLSFAPVEENLETIFMRVTKGELA
jgi:ABC-2 type transport system ATP-binding protein